MSTRRYAFPSHVEIAETEGPHPTRDELVEARQLAERRRERAHRARAAIQGARHGQQ